MELLSHILAQGEVQITFPQQNEPFTQIVEGQCYQALCKIKAATIAGSRLVYSSRTWSLPALPLPEYP